MATQTTPLFLKTQSFSNTPNPSKPSPMSMSPKSTNTRDYSPMSTSPANNNKVYKHYTSINDLKSVEEDCTQAMILLGSDKPLQVSYPGDNENPIDVDATSDFSNLASRQSKSTFLKKKSKRVFENQFDEYQSAKRSREESTLPIDTTTSISIYKSSILGCESQDYVSNNLMESLYLASKSSCIPLRPDLVSIYKSSILRCKIILSSSSSLLINSKFKHKCKWQKENTVGRKVTNGMDLANILTNVASIASTGLELNMVFVRNINGDTRKIMLVIATLLAINHKEL
ncbi:hypothetical protein RND71_009530 [Anisodus tanguticus]|uniref:Uncharacterized protein n=2 Tax=Anisodus tanguticus TaxID=243964 RepID=A0AAE1SHY2_9SOLA|nr:hypothetical protein RND71_009530 [Anisodus tanguticus]